MHLSDRLSLTSHTRLPNVALVCTMFSVGLCFCFCFIIQVGCLPLQADSTAESLFGDKGSSSSTSFFETIRRVQGAAGTDATVIWLHGLGDGTDGWTHTAKQFQMPWVKFIYPQAKNMQVTINHKVLMPAWFDITNLQKYEGSNCQDIALSAEAVDELIDAEVESGTVPERIVIVGFSQGGVIAAHTAIRSRHAPLGGAVLMSTWFPCASDAPIGTGLETPFLQCHGTIDPTVQFHFGEQSAKYLEAAGYNIAFRKYTNLKHSANEAEFKDIRAFLMHVLPENSSSHKEDL